jgi:hypothetical protein
VELDKTEIDFENFKKQLAKITGPIGTEKTDNISLSTFSWQNPDQYDPRMAPLKPLTTADISSLSTANFAALTTSNITSYNNLLGLTSTPNTLYNTTGSYTLGVSNSAIYSPPNSTTLNLDGPDADIKINGVSIVKKIDAIAERLALLVPNPEIESEWDQLKDLGDKYRALEAKLIEQGKMWDKLKSMPKPEL